MFQTYFNKQNLSTHTHTSPNRSITLFQTLRLNVSNDLCIWCLKQNYFLINSVLINICIDFLLLMIRNVLSSTISIYLIEFFPFLILKTTILDDVLFCGYCSLLFQLFFTWSNDSFKLLRFYSLRMPYLFSHILRSLDIKFKI